MYNHWAKDLSEQTRKDYDRCLATVSALGKCLNLESVKPLGLVSRLFSVEKPENLEYILERFKRKSPGSLAKELSLENSADFIYEEEIPRRIDSSPQAMAIGLKYKTSISKSHFESIPANIQAELGFLNLRSLVLFNGRGCVIAALQNTGTWEIHSSGKSDPLNWDKLPLWSVELGFCPVLACYAISKKHCSLSFQLNPRSAEEFKLHTKQIKEFKRSKLRNALRVLENSRNPEEEKDEGEGEDPIPMLLKVQKEETKVDYYDKNSVKVVPKKQESSAYPHIKQWATMEPRQKILPPKDIPNIRNTVYADRRSIDERNQTSSQNVKPSETAKPPIEFSDSSIEEDKFPSVSEDRTPTISQNPSVAYGVSVFSQWKCPYCKFNNMVIDAEHCLSCRQKKPDFWLCPNCEVRNDTNICSKCGKKKGDFLIWVCKVCTFSNYMDTAECIACGNSS